jgi:hypothetical protein
MHFWVVRVSAPNAEKHMERYRKKAAIKDKRVVVCIPNKIPIVLWGACIPAYIYHYAPPVSVIGIKLYQSDGLKAMIDYVWI